MTCATSPSGWSSDLTKVATRLVRSSRTVTTRLERSRLPPDFTPVGFSKANPSGPQVAGYDGAAERRGKSWALSSS
jgi:hypothetical protein